MAYCIILNYINTKLLAMKTYKKQRAQYIGTQYNSQKACMLSLEVVEKRRRLAKNKEKEKQAKSQTKGKKQDD